MKKLFIIAIFLCFVYGCSSNPAVEPIFSMVKKYDVQLILENAALSEGQKQDFHVLVRDEEKEQVCEYLWQYRKPLIIKNKNLSELAKELWLVMLMQYRGWSDEQISKGIKLYKERGDVEITLEMLQSQSQEAKNEN